MVPLTGAIPRTVRTDGEVVPLLFFKHFFLIPSGPVFGVDFEWACFRDNDLGGRVVGVLNGVLDRELAGVVDRRLAGVVTGIERQLAGVTAGLDTATELAGVMRGLSAAIDSSGVG